MGSIFGSEGKGRKPHGGLIVMQIYPLGIGCQSCVPSGTLNPRSNLPEISTPMDTIWKIPWHKEVLS